MSTGILLVGLPNIYPKEVMQTIKELDLHDYKIYGVFWETHKNLKQNLTELKIFEEIHLVTPFLDNSFLPDNFWKYKETIPQRVLSMFLLRERSLHFLDFDKHDNWIVTRPDLGFSIKPTFNNELLKKDHIYIPEEGNFRNGVTDTFAYGSKSSIKIYLSILYRIREILEEKESFYINTKDRIEFLKTFKYLISTKILKGSCKIPLHPETIIKRDLIKNGLKVKAFKTGGIKLYRKDLQISLLKKQPFSSSNVLNIQKMINRKDGLDWSINKHF